MSAISMFGLGPETPTFADRCKSGKTNFTPKYLPGTTGLKDVRLSASQHLDIRVETRIGVTGGIVSGALREYDETIRNKRRSVEFKSAGARKRVIRPDARGMLLY